jgi:hypothetical protein
MNRARFMSNALLWATAILAAAIAGAPTFFSTLILPVLAACALLITWPGSSKDARTPTF